MIFFSIIIPTFNSEEDIVTCCLSVISQTCKEYEILVQDGLSTDGTLDEINKIRQQYPEVSLSVVSNNDLGIYDAMNRAILRASGKWVLFLGSDDRLYDPNVLSTAMNFLSGSSARMVYGNVQLEDANVWSKGASVYDGAFSLEKLFEKNICHQAIFYQRSVFAEIGFFDLKFSICADWDFNFRCFAKIKAVYIDLIVSFFSAQGISNIGADEFKEQSIFSLKKYFKISYFNHLFKTYGWVFLHHSIKAFKEKKIFKSVQYLIISFYHIDDKFLLTKIVLRKLAGI